MAHPPTMDYSIESGGIALAAHLARPDRDDPRPLGVVVCHGFPVRGRESHASGKSFPELADRIAKEVGWTALTINFRGSGGSEGDFSMVGWLDDIHAAVEHLNSLGVADVWLVGFGSGAALAICEAARNPSIRGVASVAAPADFDDWARHPKRLVQHSRAVGVIKTPGFPTQIDAWGAEFRKLTAVNAAGEMRDRPLLVIHGDADDLVPSLDARVIMDAHGAAEFRIISGGGHELRHDPRAVAVLLGWLSRQQASTMVAE